MFLLLYGRAFRRRACYVAIENLFACKKPGRRVWLTVLCLSPPLLGNVC